MTDTSATRHVDRVTWHLLCVLTSLPFLATTALAHEGHGHGGGGTAALPLALVAGGVLVLGTSLYLDHADRLDGRFADLGVFLGVVGLLAGFTLGLL